MRIALDYDDTFTADPIGWTLFVEMMKQRGHDITFVTFRHPDWHDQTDITTDAERLGIQIVYTKHRQKSHVFKADVWIDDSPQMIVSYSDMVKMQHGCEVNRDMEVDPDVL